MKTKNVYIIAGSNGAGKTTFARMFLPEYAKCPNFINADLIAQGLSPFEPGTAALKAGKLVLQQIDEFSARGLDFGFETTLSGKSYVKLLQKLQTEGYKLHLFYLWVLNTQLAIERISERVLDGGHHIPDVDVRRRFARSIDNFFNLYRPLLNSWIMFDNSGRKPELIAKGSNGEFEAVNKELFEIIMRGKTK